ncbi:Ribonucleases P/MRP protein subunit pop1, partial [Spiromyces aspiralis]
METAMLDAKKASNTRAFQTLPRHLRRRAASHNVKRMPARLRAKALSEIEKSEQQKSEEEKSKNQKRPNRRQRRKVASVVEEYRLRQRDKRWLETHVWHAKRMQMKERWGIMIAETPNEKSHRASYRAAKDKTLLQDVSFMGTIELKGGRESIVQTMNSVTSPADTSVGAKWQQQQEQQQQQQLWLRVHPAMHKKVLDELSLAIKFHGTDGKVTVTDLSLDLASFELTGDQSTLLLHTVLVPAAASDGDGDVKEGGAAATTWERLKG